MRVRRVRAIFWVATIAVATLATVWMVRTPAIGVDAVTVTRGPLRVTADEEGRTRVRQRFTIAAPVSGRLLRIGPRAGERVRRGDVVARIAPPLSPPLDARRRSELAGRVEAAVDALSAAQSRVTAALARRDDAADALARSRQLSEAELAPARDVEAAVARHREAQADADAARAAVRVAEHELQIAQAALTDGGASGNAQIVLVRAPSQGAILKVHEESERDILSGTPLVDIGLPSGLEIVADVLSADAVRIPPQAHVIIDRWGAEETLEGRVRLIEPSSFTKVSALGVEEQRVNVIIGLSDAPERWQQLGDGYAVDVHVVVWERDDVVKAPTGALFRRGENWCVFIVDGGRARERIVTIGHQTGREVEILAGLAPGAVVIDHPADRIADGVRVIAR